MLFETHFIFMLFETNFVFMLFALMLFGNSPTTTTTTTTTTKLGSNIIKIKPNTRLSNRTHESLFVIFILF